MALDPRNKSYAYRLTTVYVVLRRYEDFDRTMARLIAMGPVGPPGSLAVQRAFGPLEGRADTGPVRAAVAAASSAKNLTENDEEIYGLFFALWDRDPDAISRQLRASKRDRFSMSDVAYPKSWFEALAARLRGDAAGARAAFSAARVEVANALMVDATSCRMLGLLAMIDAGLGQREEAVSEARRACELAAKSASDAPVLACNLAVVYAWTGQPDLAFATVEEWMTRPAGLNILNQPTYGDFRLNPLWDPLRGDPRFEALVARLAPAALR